MAKKLPTAKYKEIYVVWIDSTYVEHDTSANQEHKPDLIHTKGWLVKEHPDSYVVSQEVDPDTDWIRRTTSIPKCAIKKVEVYDVERIA